MRNTEAKLAIFVDGANTHAAVSSLKFWIDWDKFYALFKEEGFFVVRGYYYSAIYTDLDTPVAPIQKLLDHLEYNQWRVISKKAMAYANDEGISTIKGNMDLEMALDAYAMASKVDTIVLVTGDGDFVPLVNKIQDIGTRVYVISTRGFVSDRLRRAADQYMDLKELEKHIFLDPNKRNARMVERQTRET